MNVKYVIQPFINTEMVNVYFALLHIKNWMVLIVKIMMMKHHVKNTIFLDSEYLIKEYYDLAIDPNYNHIINIYYNFHNTLLSLRMG